MGFLEKRRRTVLPRAGISLYQWLGEAASTNGASSSPR